MNDVLSRRIKKHKTTLDMKHSSVRRLGELENIIVGEVRGTYDKKSYCFFVSKNVISISDLLDYKNSVIDFQYHLVKNSYTGKGIRNHYKDCERLVSYVFAMLEKLENDSLRKNVH